MILSGYRIEFRSRKQLDRQKKKEKRQSPAVSDHLSKKQTTGVKPGVKNDLGYSFGLNGIQGKWRAQGDDFRTFLADFVAALPQVEFPSGLSL